MVRYTSRCLVLGFLIICRHLPYWTHILCSPARTIDRSYAIAETESNTAALASGAKMHSWLRHGTVLELLVRR